MIGRFRELDCLAEESLCTLPTVTLVWRVPLRRFATFVRLPSFRLHYCTRYELGQRNKFLRGRFISRRRQQVQLSAEPHVFSPRRKPRCHICGSRSAPNIFKTANEIRVRVPAAVRFGYRSRDGAMRHRSPLLGCRISLSPRDFRTKRLGNTARKVKCVHRALV